MTENTTSTSTGKKFYKSKTFWVNTIALAAIVVQSQTGFVIPPEAQAGIITVLNGLLRFATTEPIQ